MNAAIKHNNIGVSFLQKGRHEEALTELEKAAELLYRCNITHELEERHQAGACHIPVQSCETHQCNISTSNSFIRSTPLIMSYYTNTEEESRTPNCTMESAVVLLNMALCFHLDSAETKTLTNAMQNALALYQMSYWLAIQAEASDKRAYDLVLTSLNNLGQLHHELGDFEKSRLYLEGISEYVTYLNDHGSEVQDSQEYMLNSMVLRNSNSCARAA